MISPRWPVAVGMAVAMLVALLGGCAAQPEDKRIDPPVPLLKPGKTPDSSTPGKVGVVGTIGELLVASPESAAGASVAQQTPNIAAESVPMRIVPQFTVVRSGRTDPCRVELGNGTAAPNLIFQHILFAERLDTGQSVPIGDVLQWPVPDHKLTLSEAQAVPPQYGITITTQRGLTTSYRVRIFAFGYQNGTLKGTGTEIQVVPASTPTTSP